MLVACLTIFSEYVIILTNIVTYKPKGTSMPGITPSITVNPSSNRNARSDTPRDFNKSPIFLAP